MLSGKSVIKTYIRFINQRSTDLKKKSGLNHNLFYIGLLTIVVCISYGIGISRLSFYGDDWIYIYNYHIAGPGSFGQFVQTDRPFSAWIYVLTSALFGESVIAYHIYVLVFRWLSALLFWRILSDSFPNQRFSQIAALLFATYPGFQQQPIAIEFVMHFTSLVLVELSVWLMQKVVFQTSQRKILLFIFSLISAVLGIFTCEYFLGMELARPFFLYFTVRKRNIEKTEIPWKRIVGVLIPYFLTTCFYFFWRIFIFSFTTYEPKLINAVKENLLTGIKLLFTKAAQDIITVLPRAYRMIFSRPANISLPVCIMILAVTGLTAFVFFYRSMLANEANPEKCEHFHMLILGIALLLFSGIPYWGTFLDVSTDFPWDRSTLSFSPGAAVILAALLDMAFTPVFYCAAAASLTALSVLFHVQNTQVYIYESEKMNDYFWQLAWRAPALEPGTILASEDIPLDRTSDNDLSPIVNWQYAPEHKGLHYIYKYFDLHLREGFYYTDPGKIIPVDHTYRSHQFHSDTSKTLGLFYKKNGCLQIIDEAAAGYPGMPESLIRISSVSDLDLIQTDMTVPAQPPPAIGKEPEHGYCYYFQKTALAQQMNDQEKAYSFAKEVLSSDLRPVYAPDLAPVVSAFLQAGDIQNAESLIASTSISNEDMDYLCTYWKTAVPSIDDNEDLNLFYKSHGCM